MVSEADPNVPQGDAEQQEADRQVMLPPQDTRVAKGRVARPKMEDAAVKVAMEKCHEWTAKFLEELRKDQPGISYAEYLKKLRRLATYFVKGIEKADIDKVVSSVWDPTGRVLK